MISGKDIANRIGVSKETVSAVLSGKWRERRICTETRDRVMATARHMGYVPHHAARRLARTRHNNKSTNFDQVGLIYLSGEDMQLDTVCLAMMSGAERELSKLQASLTFVRVTEPADWSKVEHLTRAGGVDGWLIYGAANDELIERLRQSKLPIVILGDHRCTQPVHSVNVDSFAVGQMAVRHLASLGHRRIGFLGSNLRYLYERETLAGFRAALRELGLDDDERLVANLSSWTDGPADRLADWLQNADPMPTAVFASEFEWAQWVHGVLRDARIHVPRQISVLGYETTSPTAQRDKFTRIELPMAEVGREGALLLHRITSGANVRSREVRISPSLIEGWSTAAPGSKSETTNQGKIV
jgi:DNA-binding LacI/PurR family transcriptional regulator